MNCENYGTIDSYNTMDAGGIAAQAFESAFLECTNYGKVSLSDKSYAVGGIVGTISEMIEIGGCNNQWPFEGKVHSAFVGGIVGIVSCGKVQTNIYSCTNEAEFSISGDSSNIGGCFGRVYAEHTFIDNVDKKPVN